MMRVGVVSTCHEKAAIQTQQLVGSKQRQQVLRQHRGHQTQYYMYVFSHMCYRLSIAYEAVQIVEVARNS